ncbi:YecA/YgfB family protein [Paenibacillus sp. YIM B09110]|uniref:YecA/YgfB family protein n=1 Tax=Paenibacillus sp. YIM B09110 TaxID=3126102 RepID=UPI00301DEF1C
MNKNRLSRQESFWTELKYPLSHADALMTLTKQELIKLGQRMQLSGLTKYKKEELVVKLVELYAENIWPITRVWDQARWKLIKQIANNGGIGEKPLLEIQQYEYFCEIGILFPSIHEGRHVLLMPAEVVAFFNDSENSGSGSLIERNTEWIRLSIGLLNYYGVLTIEQITKFVMSNADHKLASFDMLNVLYDASLYYDEINYFDDDAFFDSRVSNVSQVINEQAKRTDLEYRHFTKHEIWRAGEPGFIERNPSFMKLEKYIKHLYEMDTEEAELMADLCLDAAKNGQSLADMVHIVQDFVEIPYLPIMNEITSMLAALYNDTKQWQLKGHSPNELAASRDMLRLQVLKSAPSPSEASVINIQTRTKVGRNDPCPCGSGKKFKKCCG